MSGSLAYLRECMRHYTLPDLLSARALGELLELVQAYEKLFDVAGLSAQMPVPQYSGHQWFATVTDPAIGNIPIPFSDYLSAGPAVERAEVYGAQVIGMTHGLVPTEMGKPMAVLDPREEDLTEFFRERRRVTQRAMKAELHCQHERLLNIGDHYCLPEVLRRWIYTDIEYHVNRTRGILGFPEMDSLELRGIIARLFDSLKALSSAFIFDNLCYPHLIYCYDNASGDLLGLSVLIEYPNGELHWRTSYVDRQDLRIRDLAVGNRLIMEGIKLAKRLDCVYNMGMMDEGPYAYKQLWKPEQRWAPGFRFSESKA